MTPRQDVALNAAVLALEVACVLAIRWAYRSGRRRRAEA